jgi:hypothetical protein
LKAATQGHANAQYSLGRLYAKGLLGGSQDNAQAQEWYLKAATQGYAAAQYSLGCLYEFGQGVLQDDAQAREWYLKAAMQGLISAQGRLGSLYAEGRGVSQDYVQAHMWFNLAAELGHARMSTQIDQIAKKMSPLQIAESQRLTREWRSNPCRNYDIYSTLSNSALPRG